MGVATKGRLLPLKSRPLTKVPQDSKVGFARMEPLIERNLAFIPVSPSALLRTRLIYRYMESPTVKKIKKIKKMQTVSQGTIEVKNIN